jgi:class 3 adenylate cyclase/tetratricopeptide (TPR) repeat protein
MFDETSETDEGAGGDKRRLASVLVADICGFSSLAERDEDLALAVVRAVSAILQSVAGRNEGRLFHEAADGFFFEFSSANLSMQAARAMLVEIARDQDLQSLATVQIRIGLHMGDVQVEPNGNLMGHGVNVAARLQQNADPGSILASKPLIDALSQRQGQFWRERKLSLKNMRSPISAFNIRDDRPIAVLLRDLWSSQRWRILAAGAAVSAAAFFAIQAFVFPPPQGPGPIDREAVRASLAPLIKADRPIDDIVSALMRTDDFDAAAQALRTEYEQSQSQLTREQSLDLLHQAAAIAVNRDASEAEELYLEILKLDPFDAEALFQMAKIYRRHEHEALAVASLEKAFDSPALDDRQRLEAEIYLIDFKSHDNDGGDQVAQLEALADRAAENALNDVEYLARYKQIKIQFLTLSKSTLSDAQVTEQLRPLIAKTEVLVEQQVAAGLLYQVSETLMTLGTLQNRIGDYAGSNETLTRALEIERRLRRPTRMMGIYANLAYLNVAWHQADGSGGDELLTRAEGHVESVRDLANREGLTSRDYYNWYILALIERQRGNATLSCSHFEKAINAWPERFLGEDDIEVMASDLECTV